MGVRFAGVFNKGKLRGRKDQRGKKVFKLGIAEEFGCGDAMGLAERW